MLMVCESEIRLRLEMQMLVGGLECWSGFKIIIFCDFFVGAFAIFFVGVPRAGTKASPDGLEPPTLRLTVLRWLPTELQGNSIPRPLGFPTRHEPSGPEDRVLALNLRPIIFIVNTSLRERLRRSQTTRRRISILVLVYSNNSCTRIIIIRTSSLGQERIFSWPPFFQYNKRLLRQKTGGACLYMPQDGNY